jgi:ribonuclease P protein component
VLPVSARLTSPHDFARTTKSGLRVTTPHFVGYLHVVRAITNPYTGEEVVKLENPKAGLIIGKSVGGSVRRHRVSRQIRHAIAARINEFPQGSLIVIRGLKQSTEVDVQSEINEILLRLLKKVSQRSVSA